MKFLYILWIVINLSLLIYFLKTGYRAIVVIRKELGLFSLLFLVGCLLSFTSAQPNPSSSHQQVANYTKAGRWSTFSVGEVVEDNLLFSIDIHLTYTRIAVDSFQVMDIQTSQSGLQLGYAWKPLSHQVILRRDHAWYKIAGILEWKLFGMVLYDQLKEMESDITI